MSAPAAPPKGTERCSVISVLNSNSNGDTELPEDECSISKRHRALSCDVSNGSHQHVVLHIPQPLPCFEVSALPAAKSEQLERGGTGVRRG